MNSYSSYREFIKAIEKQAKRSGYALDLDDRDLIETKYNDYPAWSSIDVRDALRAIGVPRKKTKPFILGYPNVSPRVNSPFDEIASEFRAALDIHTPIPISQLRDQLHLIDKGDRKIKLDYPVFKNDVLGSKLWSIHTIYLDGNNANLVAFKNLIDKFAQLLNAHPAMILAYVLCDVNINSSNIEFFQDRDSIVIQVRNPERVSPKALMKAYSITRNSLSIRSTERFDLGLGGKKHSLHKFILANPDLSWEKKLRKWNNRTQTIWMGWRYSSVPSMQASYTRIRKYFQPLEKLERKMLSGLNI